MAQLNEEARIPVYINDEQAKSALRNLQTEANKWRKAMYDAMASGDMKGMKEAERELKKTNQQAASLKKSMFDVDKVLSNLSSASAKDIQKALQAVNREMDGVNRGTKEYQALANKKTKLKEELQGINSAIVDQRGIMGKAADFVNRYWSVLAAGGGVIAILRKQVMTADEKFKNFESSISNLSALTSLEGEELAFLTKKAKELSGAMLEGGIIITKSAQDIVDGFTKMGSARPELLKDKEALAQVTEQALILSEAAKIEMEPAIAALAAVMNQFDLDATQSARIINTLAAGSLEGSAEVADLTESLKNAGTVASESNMSLEQTVAALEVLGEKQLKGAEAGTKLRGSLLKMQQAGVGYASGQFVLSDAIDEVNAKLARQSTELEKDALKQEIFGTENITAGTILLENVDKYDKLTKAVTGTNTAMEQAAKNTDNEAARRAQAQAQINNLYLEFGQKVAPLITKGIKTSLELLNIVIKYRAVLIPLVAAIVIYNNAAKLKIFWDTAQKAAAIAVAGAQALFTGNLTRATAAMKMFNAVTKLNPFILIATAVIAAGAALVIFAGRTKEVTAAQKVLLDVETAVQKSIIEEKIKVEQLMKVAKDEKKSKEDRLKAIENLRAISPEYLGDLTLEKINTEDAKKATDEYIKSLEEKARVQAAQEMLVELEKKRIDELQSGEVAKVGFWDSLWNSIKAGGNMAALAMNQYESGLKNISKAEADYLQSKKTLTGIIGDDIIGSGSSTGSGSGSGTPSTPADLTDKEITKRIEKLSAAYNAEVALIRKKHLEGKSSEDQYNADILQADLSFLYDKLNIYKKGSEDYQKTVNEALEKQVLADKTIKNLMLQAEKELAAAEIQNMEDGLKKEEALENKRWADELEGLKKQLIEKEKLSSSEFILNDAIHQTIELKEAEHQKRLLQLKSAADIKDLEDVVSEATPIDPNFITPDQQAEFFNARIALIEAQYEREKQLAGNNKSALLAAERKYNQDIYQVKSEQIDAEYALIDKKMGAAQSYISMLSSIVREESALGKALFLFNQALAIGDVWVNIAKANAKAIAISPLTFGQPWVTANTAQGVVQTGLIAAQTIGKFVKGKKAGGYTDQAITDDEVVDYVHSNEFVANAMAVRNPTVKPVLDLIDMAQRTGRIANFNLPAALTGTSRREGGFSGSGSTAQRAGISSSSIIYQTDPELKSMLIELRAMMKKGVTAKLFYREFEEYKDEVDSIRDDASM